MTTQIYFDKEVTAEVYRAAPYRPRADRDTFNDGDMVYASGGGIPALVTPTATGQGFTGAITLGIAET